MGGRLESSVALGAGRRHSHPDQISTECLFGPEMARMKELEKGKMRGSINRAPGFLQSSLTYRKYFFLQPLLAQSHLQRSALRYLEEQSARKPSLFIYVQ